jgi:hypothetical protein
VCYVTAVPGYLRPMRSVLLTLCAATPAAAQVLLSSPITVAPRLGSVAFDPARGKCVLGQMGQGGTVGTRWDWDGSRWHPTSVAYPNLDLVFDDVRGRMLGAFFDSSGVVTEEDGPGWTPNIWAAAIPGTTGALPVAFDSRRGRLVAAGNRVLEWDGRAWSVAPPLPHQPMDAALGYDRVRQRIVLFGGTSNGIARNDTWLWDGAAWTQLATATSPPPSTAQSLMGWDPLGNRLLLYGAGGNQTWALDATDWHRLPTAHDPGPQPTVTATFFSARMAFDGTGMLLVGDGGTWRFDGVDWRLLALRPRSYALVDGLRWFSGTAETMLLEADYGTGYFTGEAFAWDGSAWRRAAPSGSVPPRVGFGLAEDPARSTLVLFGGWAPSGPLGDTWTWNAATWTRLQPVHSPSPRMYATMATDAIQGGVLLFGGWSPALADTWLWNGTDWSQIAFGGPPPRLQAAAAAVPSTGHILMSGGYSGPGRQLDDTWEWDGVQWTARGMTPFAQFTSMDFDWTLQQPVAVGTASNGMGQIHHLLTWSGSSWTPADLSPGIPAELVASDPYRRTTIVAGSSVQVPGVLTQTPATAVRFDSGCAAGRPPLLDALELPRLGEPAFGLEVATGAPNAPTLFVLGLTVNNLALGNGCTLLVDQTFAPVAAAANAGGVCTLPLPIPILPILRGLGMRAQAAVADPARGAFAGFTLTNGLLLRPGD